MIDKIKDVTACPTVGYYLQVETPFSFFLGGIQYDGRF